jgi:hypothetical protein
VILLWIAKKIALSLSVIRLSYLKQWKDAADESSLLVSISLPIVIFLSSGNQRNAKSRILTGGRSRLTNAFESQPRTGAYMDISKSDLRFSGCILKLCG